MASIVSAGTTSATALNMSADTSGVLQLASNNGTVALTISTSQNVGIGTTSPATPLDVTRANGGNFVATFQNTSSATPYCVFIKDAASSTAGYPLLAITNSAGTDTFLRVDSNTGNVMIGTSSTRGTYKLDIRSDTSIALGSNATYFGTIGYSAGAGLLSLAAESGGGINFLAGATERGRFDSSGNWLVGTTSQLFAGFNDARVNINTPSASYNGMKVQVNGGAQVCFMGKSTVDTYYWGYMLNAASGNVGTIACNSTSTSYNTSSDYRLKENIAPMTDALGVVSQLKPCTYNWKADGSEGQGFIAHELQEVLPEAVTGEKDATRTERYEISPAVPATYDEEGNVLTPAVDAVMGEREIPVYQGIDTSFLVATLTAAIQELNAKVTALENK